MEITAEQEAGEEADRSGVNVEGAPYYLIAIPVCVALIAAALRRTHGLRYWTVALGVIVLSIGLSHWLLKGDGKAVWIFVCALPMSAAFATANAIALRARPWLIIIIVPLVYLATVLVGVVLGVNLGFLSE